MWSKFLAALSNTVKTKGGQWFMAVMASLGIGLATQTLVTTPAVDGLLEYMQSVTSGGGQYIGIAVEMLAYCNVDKAITMVLSAYAARASIRAARVYFTRKA